MMEGEKIREQKSLEETPTWAVGTVITVMVAFGFLVHTALKHFGKWLEKTKKKSLLAALEKIKEELMLFGLLSLLMGHWIVFIAKICIKSSMLSSRFYPCALPVKVEAMPHLITTTHLASFNHSLKSVSREQMEGITEHAYCPPGHESIASHESLEQLHRLVFVLGIIHVSYSFAAIALAMIKIYSWRVWEQEAKTMASESLQGAAVDASNSKFRRATSFIANHASHSWSHHPVLVWLLCFSRQLWSSINRADYMAMRMGFLTTHQLPFTYDFHNYMLRSMDEEFRDIVGISVPLWIYAIFSIFLDFHGTDIYFWLSFLPAILILVIGTKLHRIVVKLAVELVEDNPQRENHQFKLRDDLFWFAKPRLLLWLIQLISFQNAFEMASFLWSMWEIKDVSCFMDNHTYARTRLIFGVVAQFWCSFITFPLYVIITQMGSNFKRSVISENVRESLSIWHERVRARQGKAQVPLFLS